MGLHEFAEWTRRVGSELMLAVNLGTRGVQEALDLVEYTNAPTGSALADQRAANGSPEPFDVRMWCLGNEMDGPWQLGHSSAAEYGALASRTAKALRQLDPRVQLVVCGSSSRAMPTFGVWERQVLEHTYEDVDYISCHAYYQEHDGDLASFLAVATDMESFIDEVVATADHVKAVQRSAKTIDISFDEWNVWYIDRSDSDDKITDVERWPYAPRLLEDVYTVADAVVVGDLLITLLRHADRVKAASLAQLVNVIAPIMTEPGGPAWRQTTFFPFAITSRLAGPTVLRLETRTATTPTAVYGDAPVVTSVATLDPETGAVAVFLVNRSTTEAQAVSVGIAQLGALRIAEAVTLSDDDPYAQNTLADPERVAPAANSTAAIVDGRLTITLPPVSWSAVSLVA